MSASLVGSEMCIRDSPSTPEARALRSAGGSCSSEARRPGGSAVCSHRCRIRRATIRGLVFPRSRRL
eukprot:206442-Alexandrium_andersonii.AAC.1